MDGCDQEPDDRSVNECGPSSVSAAEAGVAGAGPAERGDDEAFDEIEHRAAVGAVPVHSAAELDDLADRLGSRQTLLLARWQGTLIAGSWALRGSDRVGISFYVCQDREHRRLRATNLLTLRALEWAAERGRS